MNYNELRPQARSGDVLLLRGHGVGSLLVRILTAETWNHVALLVWIENGLWVLEARQRAGVRMTPASQWIPHHLDQGELYYGIAPGPVRGSAAAVEDAALSQRWQAYSTVSLVTVWLGRLVRRRLPVRLLCSTLVGTAWHAAGVRFPVAPVPGDVARTCTILHRIHASS